jgi:hypothetical protein
MAKAPAAAPADDDEDDTGATDAGAEGEDAGEDTGHDEDVICTICKTADGTYTVHEGDEPEGGEDEGEGGEPSGEQPDGADEGEQYDSIGAVLKAVMDILQKDAEGGEGGAMQNFTAGYEGGAAASPAKAGMNAPVGAAGSKY